MQKICGDYEKQNITFTAFDHYGFPAFGNNKQALLFLNKYKNDDTIYHVRYQYFPLYLTKDGRWASSYQYQEYSDETNVKQDKPKKFVDITLHFKSQKTKLREERFSIKKRWSPKRSRLLW